MFIEQLDPAALEIKFIHSAGPGGQNVNKVATAVQLRFELGRSGLSPAQLARLTALFPGQISGEGFLIITARNQRSQALNKAEALTRLEKILALATAPPPKPRKATRPSRRAVERRLDDKKKLSLRKAGRTRQTAWDKD